MPLYQSLLFQFKQHQNSTAERYIASMNSKDQTNSMTVINLSDLEHLNQEQRELLLAVELNNGKQFIVLGGANNADLNFPIGPDRMFLLLIAAAKGNDEMINLMLQNPRIDVNKCDKYGVNAFWIAAFYGQTSTLELLSNTEINRYAKNQNGSNALHMAVKRNNDSVLMALIELGYNLNQPKNNGVTALGIAALADQKKSFVSLLDAGADPFLLDEKGIGVMYLAIKGKSRMLLQYLLNLKVPIYSKEAGYRDNSPIFYAIRSQNREAVSIMANTGVDQLNFMTNSHGHNPLTYAAYLKHFELVEHLAERGMLVDVEDREGKTILLRALESYNKALADKLLGLGADINLVNRSGKTTLTILVQRHYLEQVRYLLERGADPHIEDLEGRDTCDYAELNDVHVFVQLQNCRKQNMHLRRPCELKERQTVDQASKNTLARRQKNLNRDEKSLKQAALEQQQEQVVERSNKDQIKTTQIDSKQDDIKTAPPQAVVSTLEQLLKKDEEIAPLQALALEHQMQAQNLENQRQAEFNEQMMRQRQELTKTAANNQAALKAKLLTDLKDMGEDGLESGDEYQEKDDKEADPQVAPYYPPNYFSKEDTLGVIKLREDREIIQRKKRILDNFNARKALLKQNLAAQKLEPSLEEGRRKLHAKEVTMAIEDDQNSSADERPLTQEQNQAITVLKDPDQVKTPQNGLLVDKNVQAVETQHQLNQLKKRNAEFKKAREQTKALLNQQHALVTQSLNHEAGKLSQATERLEERIIQMDLLQKPQTVTTKTPLERELARLRGYGSQKHLTVDAVTRLEDEALDQDKTRTIQSTRLSVPASRKSSATLQLHSERNGNVYQRAGTINQNIVRFQFDPSDFNKNGPDPRNVSLPLLPTAPQVMKQQRVDHNLLVNQLYYSKPPLPTRQAGNDFTQNSVSMPVLPTSQRGSIQQQEVHNQNNPQQTLAPLALQAEPVQRQSTLKKTLQHLNGSNSEEAIRMPNQQSVIIKPRHKEIRLDTLVSNTIQNTQYTTVEADGFQQLAYNQKIGEERILKANQNIDTALHQLEQAKQNFYELDKQQQDIMEQRPKPVIVDSETARFIELQKQDVIKILLPPEVPEPQPIPVETEIPNIEIKPDDIGDMMASVDEKLKILSNDSKNSSQNSKLPLDRQYLNVSYKSNFSQKDSTQQRDQVIPRRRPTTKQQNYASQRNNSKQVGPPVPQINFQNQTTSLERAQKDLEELEQRAQSLRLIQQKNFQSHRPGYNSQKNLPSAIRSSNKPFSPQRSAKKVTFGSNQKSLLDNIEILAVSSEQSSVNRRSQKSSSMRFTEQGHITPESHGTPESSSRKLQWDVKKPVVYAQNGVPMLQSDRRALKKAIYTNEQQTAPQAEDQ